MRASICIVTHNAELSIRSTLDSIRNQAFDDFEVIIVDDHSTDSTVRTIYNEYCSRDKRFKMFVNYTVKDYVDAYNLSYEKAKGDYLFRVGQDTILNEDYLEYHIKFLDEHPDVDAFSTMMEVRRVINGITYPASEEAQKTLELSHAPEEVKFFNEKTAYSYCGNTILWTNSSTSLRKTFYDKYQPKYLCYAMGDYIFWWSIIASGGKLYKDSIIKSIDCDYGNKIEARDDYYIIPFDAAAEMEKFKAIGLRREGYEDEAKEHDALRVEYENRINGNGRGE